MSQGDFVRTYKDWGPVARGRRLHLDLPLLLLLALLCGFGLVTLYSASGSDLDYVKRQATFMAVGWVVMLVVAQIDPRTVERWSLFFYVGGVILLLAVLVVGVEAKGAQRWLDIGITRVQPSELMKVALPVYVSAYLGRRPLPPRFEHVMGAVILILMPPALIGLQPDLGTALVIASTGAIVLLLSGLSKRYIFGAFISAMAALPVFWFYLLHDYQKTRILTMLDPQQDKLGAGWNIIQSTTAIGSGGFEGKGYMLGTQSHLNFLPESHTDFIIAVLSEEFGFVGVFGLMVIYALIIARCLMISLRAQSMYGKLYSSSVSLGFFVYIFVNMGMVSGILPVVGMPLPFMSYGGTAILTMMLGFGLLMAISTEKRRN